MSFEEKPQQHLITSAVNNMASTFFSNPGNVTNAAGFSIQSVWSNTSTAVGAQSVQASNDLINWVDIPSSSLPVTGSSGSNMWNTTGKVNYNFTRLVYTSTSGNGTLNAVMESKS